MAIFTPYTGDLIGLPTTRNHLVFRWRKQGVKILFSMTRHGEAMSIHFASNKNGLRYIKEAINAFCEFVFKNYAWCRIVVGKINRNSVAKVALKCGFHLIASSGDQHAYVRVK